MYLTSMDSLETAAIQCPYCWQRLEIEVDRSAGNQRYVEDCHVCCRPILIRIRMGGRGGGRGEDGNAEYEGYEGGKQRGGFTVEAEPENG